MLDKIYQSWEDADGLSQGVAALIWLAVAGAAFTIAMSLVFAFYIQPKADQSAWQIVAGAALMAVAPVLLAALGIEVLKDRLPWGRALPIGVAWGITVAAALAVPGLFSALDQRLWIFICPLLLIFAVHRSSRAFAIAIWAWLMGAAVVSVAAFLMAGHMPS